MDGFKTSVKKYIKNNLNCPRCGSEKTKVTLNSTNEDDYSARNIAKICLDCGLNWVEVHSITKVLITKV